MAKDVLFTRETFLAAMRREKKRKQDGRKNCAN